MQRITPDNPNIRYFGRWDRRDKDAYSTSWGGTYFKLNVTGKRIKLHVRAKVNLYVNVDGAQHYYEAVEGIVDVTPQDLCEGMHTLRVATPYTDQCLIFKGVWIEPDAKVSVPSVGMKKIEYIGASIIAGYMLSRQALSGYAWLTAERLGYEHTQIAQSGMSLLDRWEMGSYIDNGAGMSEQFFKLKHADSGDTSLYDFTASPPDVVLINIGTNDRVFHVPSSLFQATYTQFLARIRNVYPNAIVYAQRLFDGTYEHEIEQAVHARHADGDHLVRYIDTSGWLSKNDYIDGIHPNEQAHVKISERLVEVLAQHSIQDEI